MKLLDTVHNINKIMLNFGAL